VDAGSQLEGCESGLQRKKARKKLLVGFQATAEVIDGLFDALLE
jgi:hypothetical protein